MTLADTTDTLLSSLSPALVTDGALSKLRQLAQVLPPIPRGIFECRLDAGAAQVDLSQAILGYGGEPDVLMEHIARMSPADVHPTWASLRDFCTRWIDPSFLLHGNVRTIWLELDAVRETPSPSLFFTLKPEGLTVSQAYAVAQDALGVLLAEANLALFQDNVRRCFDACDGVARIYQVGVMLARQTDALRLCVHPLNADSIAPYLARVGWPGPVDELASLVAWLLGFVDRIDMIDLDVGSRIYPQVGFECVFEQQPHREPRWAVFLDDLVARGLCAPDKRDAVLAWPGYTDPTPGPLPQLPEQIEVLKRRVSHVKIVYQPQRPLEAKAYLWFNRVGFELRLEEPDSQFAKPQNVHKPAENQS